ncbi:Mannosylglycerate hydrolase [Anaerohalosphaera lusitana]|uniref:Mannosylglycerate hydrolase n=1 Tax=Anaerohalosphaera lusitana TaxID=1936003 RepID=A0A1U9NLZ6_9BACT|nr:Mannosylglycerate hydrolase [Anaerohalosphaera lusitana]
MLTSLFICQVSAADEVSVEEVNVALAKWGTTSTASSNYGPSYKASNILDGRWASRETDKWNSAATNEPHWVSIDLGTERTIHKIVIKHEGVLSDGDKYNTSDFRIQKGASLHGPWDDLVSPVRGNIDDITIHEIQPTNMRYIRVLIEKGAQDNNLYARIYEVEAYARIDRVDTLLDADFSANKYRNNEGTLETQARLNVFPVPTASKLAEMVLTVDNGEPIKLDDLNVWIPVKSDPIILSLAIQGKKIASRSVMPPKPLDWGYFADGTIHIICSSHNDIAWFDTPAETIARRDHACITPALKRMEERKDVTFSMENVLYLLEYLERHPEKREEIYRLTATGQFDWGATYNQPYEALLSGEQLVRELYYGRKLIRKMIPGASARVAYNPDVPGRTMQMPQILAKAGVPYLLLSRHKEGLANWESPDGSSILAWSMGLYVEVDRQNMLEGNLADNIATVKGQTAKWASDYDQRQIPADFAFLHSDDYISPADYDKQIQDWQANRSKLASLGLPKTYIPPTMKYSSPESFFDAVSAGSPSFETIEGERPNLWLYIHGPTHHKAISAKRQAGVLLPAAEIFSTVDALLCGSFNYYPDNELAQAWQASIYDDHGWGGVNGHVTDQVFREKLEFARDKGNKILNESLQNIATRITTDNSKGIPVVVFNALSWQRSDPVIARVKVPYDLFHMVDTEGNVIPHQVTVNSKDEISEIQFVAENMPSLGYKTFYLTPGKASSSINVSASDNKYENKFYRITFGSGGLEGIYDKKLEREILRADKFLGGEVFTMQSVGHGAGEFVEVQQPTMQGFEKVSSHKPKWKLEKSESGSVKTVYSSTQKLKHCTVQQRIVIYNNIKRIDCEILLIGWDGTKNREFRMALPINMDHGEVAYEVPMGVLEVGKDEIEGPSGGHSGGGSYMQPCKDVRPREVQNFITSSSEQFAVTMSSSVAVCDWVDPTTHPADYPILQPILLASRKSCHWEGNWYLQPGDHEYSFSILSHEPGWKNGYRFGIQANNPLRAIVQEKAERRAMLPPEQSFFNFSADNVLLSTIKKCEDDNSVIVRLYDIEGEDTSISLQSFFDIKTVQHTNIIEEEGYVIPSSGNEFKTEIGHHSIETFKLWPQ